MESNLIENRQIRVFISSTFRDMQDERDEIIRKTLPKLRKIAAERDVVLTMLDLRWGITKDESESGKVVEICLKEIDNCVPFFIGIIGNRYGWRPQHEDIFNSESFHEKFSWVYDDIDSGLSVTEMEMQYGVLRRDKPTNAFFYIKKADGEIKDSDTPENQKLLNNLKDEVRNNRRYPVRDYSSADELAGQIESDLISLLDRIFPDVTRTPLEKEQLRQRSLLHSLTANIVSNQQLLDGIDDFIACDDKSILVLNADAGYGKSTLLADWIGRNGGRPIYFNVAVGGEQNVDYLIKYLCQSIYELYPEFKEFDDNEYSSDTLNMLFKRASDNGTPLIAVIDTLDALDNKDGVKTLSWLPRPKGKCKIIIATKKNDQTFESLKAIGATELAIPSFSIQMRREICQNVLSSVSKKLTEPQICKIADCELMSSPILLNVLLEQIISFGSFEKLDDFIDMWVSRKDENDFYNLLLDCWEDSFGTEFIKEVLAFLISSYEGLTELEIQELTGCTPLKWSNFYGCVGSLFLSRNGYIYIGNSIFTESIRNKYSLHDEDDLHAYRVKLLSYFECNDNYERQLTECTYQSYTLDESEKLYVLLTDKFDAFNILYKKCPYQLGLYWKKLYDENVTIDRLIDKDTENQDKDYINDFYNDLGKFASAHLGDINAGIRAQLKLLEVLAKEQPDSDKTIIMYENLGYSCARYVNMAGFWAMNKFEVNDIATDLYKYALGLQYRKHGKYSEETGSILNGLGICYLNNNDYSNAKMCFSLALEIFNNIFENVNRRKSSVLHNLAICENKLYPSSYKCIEIEKEALNMCQMTYGEECEPCACIYHTLASWLGEYAQIDNSKYDEAYECFSRGYQICNKIFGPDDERTEMLQSSLESLKEQQAFQKMDAEILSQLDNDEISVEEMYRKAGELYAETTGDDDFKELFDLDDVLDEDDEDDEESSDLIRSLFGGFDDDEEDNNSESDNSAEEPGDELTDQAEDNLPEDNLPEDKVYTIEDALSLIDENADISRDIDNLKYEFSKERLF